MWTPLLWTLALSVSVLGVSAPAGLLTSAETPARAHSGVSLEADTIQAGDSMQEIRLVDGSVIYARVIAVSGEEVTAETAGGVRLVLARSQISSARTARGEVVDGRFWRADPNHTRLFFAPTARPLRRGEGYAANYMLFFPFVGYGVTERFSMAGGTPVLPSFMGEVLYLAPKVTVASRAGMDFAVGGLALFATSELDEGSIGIVYGAGTFGDVQRSLSAGVGWGFTLLGDHSSISNDPVFMLGGDLRIGESTKLLTENWFVVGSGDAGGIAAAGLRMFGERLSADLGLGMGVGSGSMECCLPIVNFVYMFGNR
ncbi:MAG: hypothetical protein WD960_08745 [Gemmatimonadota bacterium]